VIAVPDVLGWWREEPGGDEWLERLPRLAAECAERWSLRLGEPFPDALVSLVLPAERGDGTRAVLKLNFPEPESEHEADALAFWGGVGAVSLLEHDPSRGALLVERAEPGTQAWALPEDEATREVAGILRRLHREPPPGHPFRALADAAASWADELPAVERRLLDEWRASLDELLADPVPPVVLHQDLHGGNVIRSDRGWVAIDPKPLVGDPAFDVASVVRDRRPVPDRRTVERRLDLLHDELGLDRERMRAWSFVHALGWGPNADMVAAARLLSFGPA
jgi:streptomycin 6-kinase